MKVIEETWVEAWEAVSDLVDQGVANVIFVADGRVSTTREFALTLLDPRESARRTMFPDGIRRAVPARVTPRKACSGWV